MKPFFKLYLVIVFFCALYPASGQEISDARWIAKDTTSGSVQVVAYWKKGEKKKFRAYKLNKVFRDDSLISEKKVMDAIMQFEVTDSAANSYDLVFRMLENKQRDASAAISELPIEQLDIRDEDLALRYTTDTNGMLKSYINRSELEGKLGQIMKMIRQKQMDGFKDKSEGERKAITAVGDKIASGKVLFSTMYETFVSQFHNLHGYATGLNDTLNYRESIIHPATNKPISFDCYLYLAAIDTMGVARFDIEKFADMKEFAKDYAAFLQRTREASGLKRDEKFEQEASELDMQMDTYVTTIIDTESGWPTYMKVSRVVATKAPKSKETEYRYEVWELDSDLEDR
nr:hypothetical protein [uncultured Dyadobacter sp.]